MAEVSRTARVIQNAKVALFFYCINLILQFFSRKIFLDYLGAELLGLNTTAQNLLQFLNLAESGIGAAVAFALYKPLSQKNRQEIIDIVSLQGWFYRWVGLFVIAGSIVLMGFFPWIFAKAQVSLAYAYGTFITFLVSALLSYFVNYKMIVLLADQKEYKITFATQSIKVVKVFVQIFAIWMLPHGYVWWMILEVLASIITAMRLTSCVKAEYPWLLTNVSKGRNTVLQYPFILEKIKQLVFHKIGYFVWIQTPQLLIYAFSTLSIVAIYSNYLFVISACLIFVDALFRGFGASIGNLVSEENLGKIKRIFWELATIKLITAGLVCSSYYYLVTPFVRLWVGANYTLSPEIVFLITLIHFIELSKTYDFFTNAFGLFHDILAPIAQVIINIVLSILFGYLLGWGGVLLGVLSSQVLIICLWKPYFLFRSAFKQSADEYFCYYLKKTILLLIPTLAIGLLFPQSTFSAISNFLQWSLVAIKLVTFYILTALFLFYLLDCDVRRLFSRYLTGRFMVK